MSNSTKYFKRKYNDDHLPDLNLKQYPQAALRNNVHQTQCQEPKTH